MDDPFALAYDDPTKPKQDPFASAYLTSRTDRHNNPIASSIAIHPDGSINTKDPTTGEWVSALDRAGIHYTAGDSFGGNRATLKFTDPESGARAADVLLRTSAFNWYKNQTGKNSLASIDSPQAYAALSESQRLAIIQDIYKHEESNGKLQLPNSLSQQSQQRQLNGDPFATAYGNPDAPHNRTVDIKGMPWVSGAISDAVNIPVNIGKGVGAVASDYVHGNMTPNTVPGAPAIPMSLATAAAGMFKGVEAGGLGGFVRSAWDMTVGAVINQVKVLADNANSSPMVENMLNGIPGMRYYTMAAKLKPMSDEERFRSGEQFTQVAAAAGAGMVAGKFFGASAKLADATTAYADAIKATGFKDIGEAIAALPNSTQAEFIAKATSNTLGDVVSHGVPTGVASGVAMSLAEAHADGQDVLDSAFQYGFAGALIGGLTETVGFKLFRGKENRIVKSPKANETFITSIKNNIARNMVQDFSKDNAIEFSKDIMSGVDLVSAYKRNMDGSNAKIVTGLPSLTTDNLSDPKVGKYLNEDGTYNALITTDGSKITPDQIGQFNKEGYVTGEVVNRNGTNYIYDGKSQKSGLLRLRNLNDGTTHYASESSISRPNSMVIYEKGPSGKWLDPTVDPLDLAHAEYPLSDYAADRKALLESLPQHEKDLIESNMHYGLLRDASKVADVTHSLMSNGYYINPASNGYTIRSFTNPDISIPIESMADARDYVLGTMKAPDAIDLTKDIQATVAPGLEDKANTSVVVPINGEVSTSQRIFDKIRTILPIATPGDSAGVRLDIVPATKPPNVGICGSSNQSNKC